MSEHKGKTGKITTIKLTPEINRVIWTKGAACAGGKAGLQADTHFVGNNSDIKIQLKDSSGKNLSTIDSKISGNRFWKEINIPENAKDSLTAKVKLPKHNLEMDSNPLTVLPLVKLKNLKWDKSEVKRGDIVKLTAEVKGIYDDAEGEVQIWEKDPDGAHDLITKIPVIIKKEKIETAWEFQYNDKTDVIPSSDETEKGYIPPEYFFRVVVGGISADSPLLKFKDTIYISLTDQKGNPVKDADYKLKLPDGAEKKGKLDSEGKAVIENLPPGKTKVSFPGLEVKAK
jgi:hypothetical protein